MRIAIATRPGIFALVLLSVLGCRTLPAGGALATLPTLAATSVVAGVPASPEAVNRPAPTATPTLLPAPTATPIPTVTPPPTGTPAPSVTPSPSVTPTPRHPLMIEVMRQADYPGSAITIEQRLDPGDNYDRYLVSYRSEGLKIYAYMTVPWGATPATGWPVILFNHGYIPPEQYRSTERYVAYADGFARQGYLVFRSDYRGHGESEGEATSAYGSPGYTVDVLNALAAVKTLPEVDPKRIGMWGHSMGGHITLRAMVVSGEIQAGVIWGGVVASYPDLFERWRRRAGDGPTPTPDPTSTRGRWRQALIDTYGTVEENPAFWAAISANSYVADLSGPLQLHHGTADASVPASFSETLYEQVQAVNRPVELWLYEGDNHDIDGFFWLAMQRSVDFFDRHVKGAPSG